VELEGYIVTPSGVEVRWGEQTYDKMMVGFFDVAVAAGVDKQHFFVRKKGQQRVP